MRGGEHIEKMDIFQKSGQKPGGNHTYGLLGKTEPRETDKKTGSRKSLTGCVIS